MSSIIETLKKHHLIKFYMSLSIEHKKIWQDYFPKACNCSECGSGHVKSFPVKSTARLLWVTAANALPHSKLEFAEILLNKALEHSDNDDDSLWIHANLAQLYYDQIDIKEDAAEKCLSHCKALEKMGYLNRWIERLMTEIKEV